MTEHEHVALSVAVDKPERCCTQCGNGDLYPRRCSQCGQRWADRACGPTHALITEELGVGDLRREAVRLQDLRIGLAELLGYSSDVAEHMADNVLLETAATVIRGVRS